MENNGIKKPVGYYIKEEEKNTLEETLENDKIIDNMFCGLSEEERKKLAEEIMDSVRIKKVKETKKTEEQVCDIKKIIISRHRRMKKHIKIKHLRMCFSHDNETER